MADANYWAVVPAAGIGSRMQIEQPKQYLPLLGKTVLDHTLHQLTSYAPLQKIVVAVAEEDTQWPLTSWAKYEKIVSAQGGENRARSVLNGLKILLTMASPNDWVLVHDAARPCITHSDIDLLIEQVADHAVGGLLGSPVRDTMKRADAQHVVQHTENRNELWHAFTPQMFRLQLLYDALIAALNKGQIITDEASAMELNGYLPLMVAGRLDNIKITYPDDIKLAAFYLQQKNERVGEV